MNRQDTGFGVWPKLRSKKTEWTDAIFENVKLVNAETDADPETIRISVDTKATINVGPYSKGGRSRGLQAVKALDHDMMPTAKNWKSA